MELHVPCLNKVILSSDFLKLLQCIAQSLFICSILKSLAKGSPVYTLFVLHGQTNTQLRVSKGTAFDLSSANGLPFACALLLGPILQEPMKTLLKLAKTNNNDNNKKDRKSSQLQCKVVSIHHLISSLSRVSDCRAGNNNYYSNSQTKWGCPCFALTIKEISNRNATQQSE